MTTLTVTAKGQVTLRRELLRHLGAHPGSKLDIEKLPNGRIQMRAEPVAGTIADFCGSLRRKGQPPVSIEDMNEAIADAWAGRR